MKRIMRRGKKLLSLLLVMIMVINLAPVTAGAASSKVNTKKYTISKKAGTYDSTVKITLKAKKGYKVYYSVGSKLSTKNLIKSGKSKKLTFKKTTTLKVYAVKKNTSITQKKLNRKSVLKKAVSYKYTIKSGSNSDTSKNDTDRNNENNSDSNTNNSNDGSNNNVSDDKSSDNSVADSEKTDAPSSNNNGSSGNDSKDGKDNGSGNSDSSDGKDNSSSDNESGNNGSGNNGSGDNGSGDNSDNSDTDNGDNNSDDEEFELIEIPDDLEEEIENADIEVYNSVISDDGTYADVTNLDTSTIYTDITWKHTTEEEFTEDIDGENDITVGDMETEGFEIEIPADAFSEDDNISKVTVERTGESIDITAQDENGETIENVILQEPVTITFELTERPTMYDLDLYRGVYKYRDEATGEAYDVYYIPDFDELKEGKVSFTTYHFSEYEPKKLTQDEAYKYAAHLRAVEKYTFTSGMQGAYVDGITKNLVDNVLTSFNLDDSALGSKLQYALSNTGNMYTISKAIKEGKTDTAISTITDVVVRTFVKEADSKIPGLSYLEATAGAIPEVWDDIVNKGDTNAARLAVAKAITEANPIAQYVQFCNELVEATADIWVDVNMEEMFKAYCGENVKYRAGSSAGEGDLDILMTAYSGAFKGYMLQKRKAYCKTRGISLYDLEHNYPDELKMVNDMIIRGIRKDFENRKAQLDAIKKEDEKNAAIVDSFVKHHLLERDLDKFDTELTCRERVDRLFDIRESIEIILKNNDMDPDNIFGSYMFKTEADRIANTNDKFAELVYIWDAADTDAEGRKAVIKYIEERYFNAYLSREKVTLPMKKSYQLSLYTMNKDRIVKGVTYSSDDRDVATVDNDGRIKGKSVGMATITVRYREKTYYCYVSVTENEPEVQPEVEMYILGRERLNTTGLIDWSITGNVKWYSNSPIVSVDYNGEITAGEEPGVCTVYAFLVGEDRLLSWKVTVKDIELKVTKTSMNIGEYCFVDLLGRHSDNSIIEEGIEWTVDEEMFVFSDGSPEANRFVLKADCIGETTIKVYIHRLDRELSCKVKVSGTPQITKTVNNVGSYYYIISLQHVKSDAEVFWYVDQPEEYFDVTEDVNGNGIILEKTALANEKSSEIRETSITITATYKGFTYHRTYVCGDF